MKAIGEEVSWVSQSWGFSKAKTGKIVAFVPAKAEVRKYWRPGPGVRKSHIKFDYKDSLAARYIVAVPRPNSKAGVIDYYAPYARWIDEGAG